MANHKRRGPKSRRVGCLLCKPSKLPANKKADRARGRREAFRVERQAYGVDSKRGVGPKP